MTSAIFEVLVPGLWRIPGQDPDPATPALLARMLGRGHLVGSTSPGWEAAAADLLGFQRVSSGRRRWLALPVSLAAGMTDLVATRVEDVAPDEWESLRAAILPELEQAGATWHTEVGGLPTLDLEGEGDWEGPPPSVALGRPMRVPKLDSPVARRLQVLGNMVQMLWFEHPVNRERLRLGRMPVQGLWFWSPGVPAAAPSVQRIAGGGSLARWLAEGAGVSWSADPFDSEAELAVIDVFSRAEHEDRRDVLLESFCSDVLAPRIARLRSGQLAEVRLHDPGAARLRLRRADWRRFWRRGRPLVPRGGGTASPR
ncbi:hypothetical protein [Thioalkalivibrio sp.]|uniref:hypothetical protein n=1 Tax=Thioalkalivibrio sp. TaxID=2093813 RepID=UPI0025ED079C|nr:hypothetical protein [Thioalkalivibrio sp.]